MLEQVLLVIHIAVLGYWLGAELVINSTFRYVCYETSVPFTKRSRLMNHVMRVDQHVRYALILQATLGTALAALQGIIPGGETVAWAAGACALAWLTFVELVHRLNQCAIGKRLSAVDRAMRYGLILLLLGIGLGFLGQSWELVEWLRWKLILFAGVIACGVGIRLALIRHFATWATMSRDGATDATNALVRQSYTRATSILILLWVFIVGIVIVSLWKPI